MNPALLTPLILLAGAFQVYQTSQATADAAKKVQRGVTDTSDFLMHTAVPLAGLLLFFMLWKK